MRHSWLLILLTGGLVSAQSGPNDQRAREILKELIEINTTDTPGGNVTRAADAVAARLKAAGRPAGDMRVLGRDQRTGNTVAGHTGSRAARRRTEQAATSSAG